jgi:hypothetical protein
MFTHQGLIAHLKSCPKRSSLPQETSASPAAGNDGASLPQGVKEINNSSRRERHHPASHTPSRCVVEKGRKTKESVRGGVDYRSLMPPEKNPGDNDFVVMPLPFTPKDTAYVLAVLGGCLSEIEYSVTSKYIRGSDLSPAQLDVLYDALDKLKNAETDYKRMEEKMRKAMMTPEERADIVRAESEERKRRAEEQLAADILAWDADVERIKQRDEEREKNGEPFEFDDGTPNGFEYKDSKHYFHVPAPKPKTKDEEAADKRVADGLAQEIADANVDRAKRGLPLLPQP